MLGLSLGALGIVFGDIGTSPLYALRECFSHEHGMAITPDNIFGVLSLILWALILSICVKYMFVVMRADNRGEGGILSLMALAQKSLPKEGLFFNFTLIVGVAGAALLYGDGIITPAISVLSAVEGLEVLTPAFHNMVVPITCVILSFLFAFQAAGTHRIGVVFGPTLLIWFFILGVLGVSSIVQNPDILAAFNPIYGVKFLVNHGLGGTLILGSVVLVVTGGEALYADMGHFGKDPIRLAWFSVALPGLALNYLGQGALLLRSPEAISNPFFLMAPDWALGFLVVVATLATVIASQALISGVFSLTRQAVQLGFSPRLQIIHTSSREIGQIYIPAVNWALFAGVIWLVLEFGSSSRLASAYGLAVTATMIFTTVLAWIVAVRLWNWSQLAAAVLFMIFLVVDLLFFVPNVLKVFHGGWVPLLVGALVYLLMTTWKKGRKILAEALKTRSIPMEDFLAKIRDSHPLRVPGTGIYMSSDSWGVPVPLLHNLKHNKIIHERVIVLTIVAEEVPSVPREERVYVQDLGQNFFRVIARYGFMETPKIRHIFEACRAEGMDLHVEESTFVLGRETIIASKFPGMAIWREKLFAVMTKNAQRPTAFFRIPPNQVIEMGIQVEI
ncbi:MAG: potassium transport protein Kup [Pseudomonadota bacterium]